MKFIGKSGFTLIELLVVVSIVGFLASVVLASLGEARQTARDTARLAQTRQIQQALEMYFNEHGEYPDEQGYTWGDGSLFVGDCSDGDSAAWERFLEDAVNPYISPSINDPLHPNNPWPYCFMYKSGGYQFCSASNPGYTFLFSTEKSQFNSIQPYDIQGEGNPPVAARYCIHPN